MTTVATTLPSYSRRRCTNFTALLVVIIIIILFVIIIILFVIVIVANERISISIIATPSLFLSRLGGVDWGWGCRHVTPYL